MLSPAKASGWIRMRVVGKGNILNTRHRRIAPSLLAILALLAPGVATTASAAEDAADVPCQDLHAGQNPQARYFLLGPVKPGDPPKDGRMLVLVLAGGDGGADFNGFLKNMTRFAMPQDAVVAQLVAVRWTPSQETVWPTLTDRAEKMKFTTEQFVEAVVRDVKGKHRIDARHVFTLSWSSGGPAAYAISLQPGSSITGSYIAQSVFWPAKLPPLKAARGHAYFLDHSPEDEVCRFRHATQARDALKAAGARVELVTYEGGHGWKGDVWGRIRQGIAWLKEQTAAPAASRTGRTKPSRASSAALARLEGAHRPEVVVAVPPENPARP